MSETNFIARHELATYRCTVCSTHRPYGDNCDVLEALGSTSAKPLLNCTTCRGYRPHIFFAIEPYRVARTEEMDRITEITFTRIRPDAMVAGAAVQGESL
jgi:hypothetical protein